MRLQRCESQQWQCKEFYLSVTTLFVRVAWCECVVTKFDKDVQGKLKSKTTAGTCGKWWNSSNLTLVHTHVVHLYIRHIRRFLICSTSLFSDENYYWGTAEPFTFHCILTYHNIYTANLDDGKRRSRSDFCPFWKRYQVFLHHRILD